MKSDGRKMKLVHFSKDPIDKLLPMEEWDKLMLKKHGDKWVGHKNRRHKPVGLWVSDESDYGWAEWCINEDFRKGELVHAYEVTLQPDAKILYLRSPKELEKFTRDWRYRASKINDLGGRGFTHEIDWPAVAKKYQGIIITPYQWELRLENNFMWYYSWDCASGCIWDIDAIKSFEKTPFESWKHEVRKP